MATGLPDYYRGIDITYQTLSELMNRPKYGAAKIVTADVSVTANAKTSLGSVSGKGMIYGGVLWVVGTQSQAGDVPILSIEGTEITEIVLYDLNAFGVNKENSSAVYLLLYDDVSFMYSVAFSRGITFETGFELLYKETMGGTPNVFSKVVYALI